MFISAGIFIKVIFGQPLSEADFKRRGFNLNSRSRDRLELVAKTVLRAYNTALEEGYSSRLVQSFRATKPELNGFYSEGLAMGLFLRDAISFFRRNEFFDFIQNEGAPHSYMACVGAGLAVGAVGFPYKRFMDRLSPLYGSLVINGIGFYHTYFKSQASVFEQYLPKSFVSKTSANPASGNHCLAQYYAGAGRALWFISGADPHSIEQCLLHYPESARADLWCGIGLACAYAGGIDRAGITSLVAIAEKEHYQTALQVGSALACHTRIRAGNAVEHNDLAANCLSNLSANQLHTIAMKAMEGLQNIAEIGEKSSWNIWLERMATALSGERDDCASQDKQVKKIASVE
ncbi:DUF1702 family protein [Microbulbifer sp. 2205BS26-8]|uniref:DUF1702 family protein n=1 Tax=Microbulbifer sp. 2205BS26-8 TaxID=3064386 RepID=UPI00273D506A|nr:DUF1702 family protein [Microbulbifer sp. 2205BS26-8]MDP5210678.1 DUF1702 family protein [Microbulbifer sp. 2205BS26-8]